MGKATRRAFVKRAVWSGVAGVGLALSLGTAQPAPTRAQAPSGEPMFGSWEQLPLEAAVSRFWTPDSGALLAEGPGGTLFRSDDAGHAWRHVAVPPPTTDVFVDPIDHTVLYATAPRELYRSNDDAATWQRVAPDVTAPLNGTIYLTISRADPSLLYAVDPVYAQRFVFRSGDRGDTWEKLEDTQANIYDWGLRFFFAHPTDAARIYLGIGHAGEQPTRDEVHISADQGVHWRNEFAPTGTFWRGGYGAQIGRFWTLSQVLGPPDPNVRGRESLRTRPWITTLARSADDGATWELGPEIGRTDNDGERGQTTLAVDPTQTNRLFLWSDLENDPQVRVSVDGGQTLALAGANGPKGGGALAVGVDGRWLYAGGRVGAWRLALA